MPLPPYFLRKLDEGEYCNLYDALRLIPTTTITYPRHLVNLMSQIGPCLRIICHHIVFWGNPHFKLPGNNTSGYRSFDWSVAMREIFFRPPASGGAQALRTYVDSTLKKRQTFICRLRDELERLRPRRVQLAKEAVYRLQV